MPALRQLGEFEVKALEETSSLLSFQQMGAMALNAINTNDFSRYAATEPDVVVSIRHMSILQAPAIAVPKLAMLNLHSGLLPAYQGVMSTFRALCHHETIIGTTLHTIENTDIDRGPAIARSQTAARFDQSYLWNVLNLYRAGSQNVVESHYPTQVRAANYLKTPARPRSVLHVSYRHRNRRRAGPFIRPE